MKYTIEATQTKNYTIEVEADSPSSAIGLLDEWIEDDFEQYQTTGGWEMIAS
jgi:hypothetical protein